MGLIISLIAIPSKKIHDYRQKKKEEKIARNYSTQAGPLPNSQTQSPSRLLPSSSKGAVGVPTSSQASQPEAPPSEEQSQGRSPKTELGSPSREQEVQGFQQESQSPVKTAVAGNRIGTNKSTDSDIIPTPSSPLNTTATTTAEGQPKPTMASDEDYAAFLEKANADPSAGTHSSAAATTQKKGLQTKAFKTLDAGASVPRELKAPTDNEEWIYVSDADEPFVAVSLGLRGDKMPDEETFAKLIDHPSPTDASIEIMDVTEWDSRGQYKDLVDATRKACAGGDVRVYKVPKGGVRVEYWVVGVQKAEKKLVGVKALAVES